MACKKEGVPFSGTPEQEAALKKVIAELKDTKGALMPISRHRRFTAISPSKFRP